MQKKFRKKKQNKRLKRIARAHTIFSVALFSLYIVLSSFYSPEFLISDIRSKFSALADEFITITAKVLGPPVKPVITLQSQCTSLNLSTMISWPSDENSTTYDIYRDGLPLITNISVSSFQDNSVFSNAQYEYVVTAHGQMSPFTAVSDPTTITHAECFIHEEPSTVEVVSIDSKNVTDADTSVTIFSQSPFFTGTSNIPNANIKISIHSPIIITGQTTANALGFWSWQIPIDLTLGQHEIFITAIDPTDINNAVQTHAFFLIAQKESATNDDNKNNDKDSTKKHPSNNPIVSKPPLKPVVQNEIDFSLSLSNNSVIENKDLSALILVNKLSNQFQNSSANIKFTIINEKGEALYTVSEKKIISLGQIIPREIFLPSYVSPGSYRLKVDLINDQFSISKEVSFKVVASPAIYLGGGIMVTYPQLLSSLGTISLWLLILLLIWLFLFSREYWLYLHALRNVTENNLAKLGLISIKKQAR